jgi:O-antigen/teichoic acid export membrane protein
MSLRKRVINASAWSLAGFVVAQAVRFGSNLLMTRLLMPEVFGVMAIATMVMAGLALFSDVGLAPNIIRSKRGHDPLFLNTAWIIQILRGLVLCAFGIVIAVLMLLANRDGIVPKDTAYADPRLPYVVAILSLSALISGLQSTKVFEASRNVSLIQVTKMGLIAQIAGVICMIAWVGIDRSIWALVAGSICASVVGTIMSHIWLPGNANRWHWDRLAYWEIIRFGKWIFVSSILAFLVLNGDRLVLGALVSGTMLGVYVIAFLIVNAVDQVLAKLITDVSFPAFSEVARDRLSSLTTNYYRFHDVIAFAAYFCSGILMVSGHTLINLLFDKRYEDAGWMAQILAVSLLTVPLRLGAHCFLVFGSAKIYTLLHAIRVGTLYIVVPIAFHLYGLAGALWGVVFAHVSFAPLVIFYMMKFGIFSRRKELLALPAVLVGVLLGIGLNLTVPLVRAPVFVFSEHVVTIK